jgi:hypothetical protein
MDRCFGRWRVPTFSLTSSNGSPLAVGWRMRLVEGGITRRDQTRSTSRLLHTSPSRMREEAERQVLTLFQDYQVISVIKMRLLC